MLMPAVAIAQDRVVTRAVTGLDAAPLRAIDCRAHPDGSGTLAEIEVFNDSADTVALPAIQMIFLSPDGQRVGEGLDVLTGFSGYSTFILPRTSRTFVSALPNSAAAVICELTDSVYRETLSRFRREEVTIKDGIVDKVMFVGPEGIAFSLVGQKAGTIPTEYYVDPRFAALSGGGISAIQSGERISGVGHPGYQAMGEVVTLLDVAFHGCCAHVPPPPATPKPCVLCNGVGIIAQADSYDEPAEIGDGDERTCVGAAESNVWAQRVIETCVRAADTWERVRERVDANSPEYFDATLTRGYYLGYAAQGYAQLGKPEKARPLAHGCEELVREVIAGTDDATQKMRAAGAMSYFKAAFVDLAP